MKLALAQISMASNMQENLEKSLLFCDQANGTDLLFFPEIQLSPFFPQYEKRNVDCYCLQPDSVEISKLKEKQHSITIICHLMSTWSVREKDMILPCGLHPMDS